MFCSPHPVGRRTNPDNPFDMPIHIMLYGLLVIEWMDGLDGWMDGWMDGWIGWDELPLAALSMVEARAPCWASIWPKVNQRGYRLSTSELTLPFTGSSISSWSSRMGNLNIEPVKYSVWFSSLSWRWWIPHGPKPDAVSEIRIVRQECKEQELGVRVHRNTFWMDARA